MTEVLKARRDEIAKAFEANKQTLAALQRDVANITSLMQNQVGALSELDRLIKMAEPPAEPSAEPAN